MGSKRLVSLNMFGQYDFKVENNTKRSPFLPIFNYHFWQLNEAGYKQRIYNKPEYLGTTSHLWPAQECEDLDGQPISMFKAGFHLNTIYQLFHFVD